jgi:hypothetical protein
MQMPQVMKEMSAPAMRVEPTKMAVQFCVMQKPLAWQQMLIGPQQHCELPPTWLFWPQQHAMPELGPWLLLPPEPGTIGIVCKQLSHVNKVVQA